MQITLKQGGRTATVDTMGGELTSYQDERGLEYIWQGDPASWTGRNPILFPIVGKLRGGAVLALGKECRMPQHGLARRREFTLVEHGEDWAVLEQREGPDTLEAYPFPYLLRVRQELKETGFTTTVTIRNTGTEDLPFCLGAHTAFRCPQRPGESFGDYVLVFDQAENLPALLPTEDGLLPHKKIMPCLDGTDTLTLDYAVFDRVDTLTFEGLRSQGVSLRHRTGGHGVHVDFTGWPMLAFWTPPGKHAPFLCIEPWHGCAAYEDETGRFEDKPYAVLLRPDKEWSLGYSVTTL
jgi:galactose mutarotase-like enzyme